LRSLRTFTDGTPVAKVFMQRWTTRHLTFDHFYLLFFMVQFASQ
jgi:hypothetical protein